MKNALVVGVPRSGTSMTTAVFAKKNYFVANDESTDLRGGDRFNPSGYFEAQDLVKHNDLVFDRIGFEPDNTWLYREILPEEAERIGTLTIHEDDIALVRGYKTNEPWVWKDPRLCYTLRYWWQLMDRENTGVLFLRRDPLETYNSFIRVKWREPSAASKQEVLARISNHLEFAQRTIEELEIPHIEVHYDDFAEAPQNTANKISDFFGLELAGGDLGFDKRLNSSGLRGRAEVAFESVLDAIPGVVRTNLKRAVPQKLLKQIYAARQPNTED